MNLERISDALQNYTGQEDSMHAVTTVLQEELGDNWTSTVFDDLKSLPPALKTNLEHVFNYYAATMAWNETQEYLAADELERTPEMEERLPILKHWLDFFGQPGQEVYQQLEDRLSETEEEVVEEDADDGTDDVAGASPVEKMSQNALEDENPTELEAERTQPNMSEGKPEGSVETEEQEETPEEPVDSPEKFEIEKLQKQLTLLDQNQAWLAARCIQLKDIEVFAYPFYGYVVDMMRQIIKSMENIEGNEGAKELLATVFAGGQEAFDNKKQAILHDIELAEQNCESAQTALISEDMDMDEVKRTLGAIDESDTVEYVGPAPDGFELLDDETPLDESAIKKQYAKLENMDAMTGEVKEEKQPESAPQENASQTDQKGVQRKLSFSLKRKKPTEGAS